MKRRKIHDKPATEQLAYFLEKTIRTELGCRLWSGFVQSNGYVKTRIGGKSDWLHRVVFSLENGSPAGDMNVCHSCDVRHCIEPSHLFAGTQLDNMRDAVSKGRQARGTTLPHTKLESYGPLLERARAGESYETIANDLGVCSQLVSRVARKNGIFRHRKQVS